LRNCGTKWLSYIRYLFCAPIP